MMIIKPTGTEWAAATFGAGVGFTLGIITKRWWVGGLAATLTGALVFAISALYCLRKQAKQSGVK